MPEVRSLGYVVISAGDLDAWEKFATELIGLQVAERTPDRLRLRNDRSWYRLDVQRGDAEGVTTLGWEVGGPQELVEFAKILESAGYDVTEESADFARDRGAMGVISFTRPRRPAGRALLRAEDRPQRLRVADRCPRSSPATAASATSSSSSTTRRSTASSTSTCSGFKLSDYIEFGPIFGVFTHCNPRHHSFAFAAVPNAPKGIGHIMFEVDDIDTVGRAYDKVVKEKAAPLAISFGRHSNDQMMSFYVNSPSGFQIEFGTGGLLIDDDTWRPWRYDVPNFWGHEHQKRA